jgi:hypothetical protein
MEKNELLKSLCSQRERERAGEKSGGSQQKNGQKEEFSLYHLTKLSSLPREHNIRIL